MSNALTKADILRLSVAETPDAIPLTDAQKSELNRRLDAYRNNPDAGTDWAVVLERMKQRES